MKDQPTHNGYITLEPFLLFFVMCGSVVTGSTSKSSLSSKKFKKKRLHPIHHIKLIQRFQNMPKIVLFLVPISIYRYIYKTICRCCCIQHKVLCYNEDAFLASFL